MATVELVRPRVAWVPEAAGSLGDEAVAFARRIGMTLDPEQEFVLSQSLGVNGDGRWATVQLGLNVPRQNGKGEILIARELFGLFELGERLVIHTAHEFKTSSRHFKRLENVVRACPELHSQVLTRPSGQVVGYRYSHGEESIELQDGRLLQFRTRTKTGMRGFDGVACLVLDEAMIIDEDAHNSALPTIRATDAERGPQVWYTGSAVDQETHAHGLVWAGIRERGIRGDDPHLTYFEWSLDFEHPDDVPDEVADDPENWRQVNFAIDRGRVFTEHMEFERKALSDRGFKVELLGVGDWPSTVDGPDVRIPSEVWQDILDPDAVLVDPICLAFDVSPDWHSTIVAAGRDEKGNWLVEVVASNHGTGWLTDRLVEIYRAHEIAEMVCDGFGPSAAIARKVDEAGIKVRMLDAGDYSNSCGMFVDAVAENTIRHLGQPELDLAVKGAATRPLVDRWAWSRTKSKANISPLVAACLAFLSATENDVGTVEVF